MSLLRDLERVIPDEVFERLLEWALLGLDEEDPDLRRGDMRSLAATTAFQAKLLSWFLVSVEVDEVCFGV